MASEINAPGNSVLRGATPESRIARTPGDAPRGPATGGQPASRADSVSITPAATRLKELEEQLARLPEVDMKRVDSIRQALADGTYRIDDERVADKLALLESILNNAGRTG